MDGLDFVKAIRRLLPDIPIIVAIGRMEAGQIEEFDGLNVHDRLDQRCTELQLAETLQKILGTRIVTEFEPSLKSGKP
jgi:CheY-like chemotaxis protein